MLYVTLDGILYIESKGTPKNTKRSTQKPLPYVTQYVIIKVQGNQREGQQKMKQNNVTITLEDGSQVHLLNVSSYGFYVTDIDNPIMFINYRMIEDMPKGQYIIPVNRAKNVTVNDDSSLYEEFGHPIIKGGVHQ